ncbi:MAG: CDP-diacylglycerol--serine O-phosphatidyltransferase [Thiohalomonadaceae bacterium]
MTDETSKKRHRGIYLLPNLFTTAALFAGFFGIVAAMNGRFGAAAVAIFIAMVLDGLDGRVARMTNTQSAFGAQYDSLADMISFGLAPALIIYLWTLQDLGKLGWLAAFIFVAGAALRLARFNTQLAVADKRFFQGLASPAAAAVLVGLVWVGQRYGWDADALGWFAFALTVIIGVLMVSNVRYYSFKDLDLKGKVPFFALLLVILIFVLISIDPPLVLFGAAMLYALSGPVVTVWMLLRRRRQIQAGEHQATEGTEDTEKKQ